MNEIFKGVKVGDKVFSYYHQKWGKVVDCGTNEFVVDYTLDTGYGVTLRYDYEGGCWLSGNITQEVFTEEIPALPADDLSNLQEGDKVFVQPHQKWGEVTKVRPTDASIDILVSLDQLVDTYIAVTNTGLYSENHKAPSIFLEEVPKPSELLTELARLYEFL